MSWWMWVLNPFENMNVYVGGKTQIRTLAEKIVNWDVYRYLIL